MFRPKIVAVAAILCVAHGSTVLPAAEDYPAAFDTGPREKGTGQRYVTTLTSGVPVQFNFPSVPSPAFLGGEHGYVITVPAGSARLAVELRSPTRANVDLYVNRDSEAVLFGGRVVAEYRSEGLTADETVTVDAPAAGSYFISFGLVTRSAFVQAVITATVFGGNHDCTYRLSPNSATVPMEGGVGRFRVETATGCSWRALTTESWLTITSAAGTGPGDAVYRATSNAGSERQGRINVGNAVFTVVQQGLPADQFTEAWQRDWNVFAREAALLLRETRPPTATRPALVTLSRFAGKPFAWEGVFVDRLPTGAILRMPSVAVLLAGGRPAILASVAAVERSAGFFGQFRAGQSVRFHGRIDQQNNVGIVAERENPFTITVFTHDVEAPLKPPVAPDPPVVRLEVSAQGRGARNGETLELVSASGEPLPVTLDAAGSIAGSGTIARYEWRMNGSLAGTQARISAIASLGSTEVELRVVNSGGLTATAGARIRVIPGLTNPQPLPRLATQSPVTHAATGRPTISANTWVTVRGVNLAPATRAWTNRDFSGASLPTSLDGVRVLFNGTLGYVGFISPGQINVLTGDNLPEGEVSVEVATPAGAIQGLVRSERTAPGFFALDSEGNYPVAVHSDGTLVGPPGLLGDAVVTRPLYPGEPAQFYGSGFGETGRPHSAGEAVVEPLTLARWPLLFIGGREATVTYAGLVGSGLNQINAIGPELPPGDHVIVGEAGGGRTQSPLHLCMGGSAGALAVDRTELVFAAGLEENRTVLVTAAAGPLGFRTRARSETGGWLSVEGGGVTPQNIRVSVNRRGLAPGTHRGSVTVSSCADPGEPKVIGVWLEVPARP